MIRRVLSRPPFAIALVALALAAPLPLLRGDGGPDHQVLQPRPIELGTSGGSTDDASGPYCCGGTLGALVTDGFDLFILGNNHVLARFNAASIGEEIHQPALIDTGCFANPANHVATLSAYIPITSGGTNLVDAAIAIVEPGTVDPTGSIIDIGPVSDVTRAPSLGLGVKKSGRTTGLTTGTIDAVNVTINVGYRKKCNGGQQVVATFVNCFRTTSGFSAGGDSGSLIVENVANDPRPVGLLFAGNSAGVTFANPIDTVLSELGVVLVGGDPPPPPATGSIAGVVSSSAGGPIAGAAVSLDTGASTSTAGDGSYSFAGVPTGTRTVSASAPGFAPTSAPASVVENQTTTVDLALDPVVAGSAAVVECIRYETYGGQGGTKHLSVGVVVRDDQGNPVEGAGVSIDLAVGSGSASGSGTTDATGTATFTLHNAANVCYATTVTSLVAAGLAWDGSTPANGFAKGTDASPDEDCVGAGDGCGGAPLGGIAAGGGGAGGHQLPGAASLQAAIATQDVHAPGLLAHPDVVGVGTSWNAAGTPVIEVYCRRAPGAGIPADLDGIETRVVVTGEIEAF